ncbi:MAG: hypothetical protein CVU91_06685 [Firmicutes bacterium HGW-Firmicutes-16]|nr:MAG: hypothetical protein CVU91_06685 [Firmicutes bacterium HGW-Firmicutes-16]
MSKPKAFKQKNGLAESKVKESLSRKKYYSAMALKVRNPYLQENIAPPEAIIETREVCSVIQDNFFIDIAPVFKTLFFR